MLHLGPIWYHSEPSDVPYSQNLPRPISWFGLFLQQNHSSTFFLFLFYFHVFHTHPMPPRPSELDKKNWRAKKKPHLTPHF